MRSLLAAALFGILSLQTAFAAGLGIEVTKQPPVCANGSKPAEALIHYVQKDPNAYFVSGVEWNGIGKKEGLKPCNILYEVRNSKNVPFVGDPYQLETLSKDPGVVLLFRDTDPAQNRFLQCTSIAGPDSTNVWKCESQKHS